MLVFYAELRGGKATWWVNLLSVNEYLSGKRNNKRAFLVSLFIFTIQILTDCNFDTWYAKKSAKTRLVHNLLKRH